MLSDHAQFSDWLMMRLQSGVTGVNIINLQAPGSCVLCAYGHQVVNVFLLVGGGAFSTSAKQLRKLYQILLSGYFREELKQRIWEKGPGWLQ